MTYKQAFDKITEAYIKGEIVPMETKFCFCGTLCNNGTAWISPNGCREENLPYTWKEFSNMEYKLLMTIIQCGGDNRNPTEEALFQGMCAALEVLKQIHISRGENVDEVPFVKRELVNA